MKHKKKVLICILVIVLLIISLSIVLFNNAEKNVEIKDDFLSYKIDDNYSIYSIKIDNVYYMFMPKSADLSNIVFHYNTDIKKTSVGKISKEKRTISGSFQSKDKYGIEFIITLRDNQKKTIKVLQSDAPAIHINLKDANIKEVNSGSKDIKYDATIKITGCNEKSFNIEQDSISFKGRGNHSWKHDSKKSYQIKLDSKENLMGIGNDKEKKWLLIANYKDKTLLNNKITNDLCIESGLSTIPNSSYTDLYVNGDYLGTYLLCDKIEINEGRIDLKDNKGVLAELDMRYYDEETDPKFISSQGYKYVIKESVAENEDMGDNVAEEALESFKNSINELEEKLYEENAPWEEIESLIDVDSFAKYYLINEFTNNYDTFETSVFMFKDGDNDKIHMGPTWDFDVAYVTTERTNNPDVNYTFNLEDDNYFKRLFEYEEFKKVVYECYANTIYNSINNININSILKTINKSNYMNQIRWYNNKTKECDAEVTNLEDYIIKRADFFKNEYGYGLYE